MRDLLFFFVRHRDIFALLLTTPAAARVLVWMVRWSGFPVQADWLERLLNRFSVNARVATFVAATGILGFFVPPTIVLERPRPYCGRDAQLTKLVMFVHGWRGDREETWQQFPRLVCKDLRFQDAEVVIIEYPTYMVNLNINIAQMANWVNEGFDTPDWRRYNKVAIVAHSLGGLIAREMLLHRRLARDERKFDMVVEIAVPHLGADVAALAATIGITQPLAEEARPGSSFLRTLQSHWGRMGASPVTLCFTSPRDWVVSQSSAVADCTRGYPHPQWDHRELAKPDRHQDRRYDDAMRRVAQYFAGEKLDL